ncbi:2820_t:CDS:2, partial [Gigaspora rosea]
NESKSRIDMIWTSGDLFNGLKKAEIQEADCITGSDHEFILAEIELSEFLKEEEVREKGVRVWKGEKRGLEKFQSRPATNNQKKPSIKCLKEQKAYHD